MSAAAISSSLFEAARLGDPQAIASVLETAQPDIRRYARATCRSSADAEDATQEAMWILFRHVGTIRSLVAFSAWLFSVVRRECLRLARKAGLAPSIDDGEVEALLLSRSEADLRLDLAAAFEALPAHYRDVALMRDVKEMTIDEIAAALGASRQTVKARLHRARALMREYLTR
ncbi:RNA polymerase sigma-70 factor (ECF subfamily) [Bradyrhizobium japonicum]|uniref:RNA polymerase sigma factor n=1 Tax=Bradyrhizobium japonicum TaxID=375 RepID=UPI001BACDD5C|nr:sigma-70 family RNA polymerase sigma factor [Bradyrhizobium japonicum]MBR0728060.1 sigma-70 family RNA polymerase sigma factor [Bradyrhizobium japonicum]MBR0803060.1 sigma-70 family RNA polymerase sigma factor [Bradyrhizobium japonicum]MBR0913104.1 sigma-70 family RNA polymerase sigma factor [Bradyrhizobium japonicum]MCS3502325.1 RNA polymerase sigma-70 factor (ECF subfamily) [Bradyrhizobium japonicum]MCS3964962.1 RNA polymerase sigma-70 factor (ECF subfamily) [Bradyrhizobium japonicum]